jgi:hypothetical protein
LIDLKYAKEYFGDTKTPWTYEELQYVVNHPHGGTTLTYLEQWTDFANASSQFSNERYAAKQVVGRPDTNLVVGANQAESPKAWAEATDHKERINTLMCGFKSIKISAKDLSPIKTSTSNLPYFPLWSLCVLTTSVLSKIKVLT